MKSLHINKVSLILILCSGNIFISSCISLKAPPITFTQTQTASEKQMIGEDKEIEKDGWLISSIKSSSSGSELWKKNFLIGDSKNKNYLTLQKKLMYHEFELRNYKAKGILGESFDGTIKFLPNKTIQNQGELSRIKELVSQVNSARDQVINLKIEENPSLKKSNVIELQVKDRFRYLEYGEFFETSKSNWEKKD